MSRPALITQPYLLDQIRRDDCLQLLIESHDALYDYDVGDKAQFVVDDGDDMHWLGYHIGRSVALIDLCINSEERRGRDRDALMRGINSNRSIEVLELYDHLDFDVSLLDNFFANNPQATKSIS